MLFRGGAKPRRGNLPVQWFVFAQHIGSLYREIATPLRPQARFGAQPPVGRLLARRCGALARNDMET